MYANTQSNIHKCILQLIYEAYICKKKAELKNVYITRRETFNAAHRLYREDWSDEKNDEVFGKCSNKNWHGHNFTLYITVKGIPNEETGFIIDLKQLSSIVHENVINPLDHKNLNLDVPFMKGMMASTENLVIKIWEQLEAPIRYQNGTLCKVKLYETENNFAEYFGGGTPF